MKGKIIYYDTKREFGYIRADNEQVYFFRKQDLPEDVKNVSLGQEVTFSYGNPRAFKINFI